MSATNQPEAAILARAKSTLARSRPRPIECKSVRELTTVSIPLQKQADEGEPAAAADIAPPPAVRYPDAIYFRHDSSAPPLISPSETSLSGSPDSGSKGFFSDTTPEAPAAGISLNRNRSPGSLNTLLTVPTPSTRNTSIRSQSSQQSHSSEHSLASLITHAPPVPPKPVISPSGSSPSGSPGSSDTSTPNSTTGLMPTTRSYTAHQQLPITDTSVWCCIPSLDQIRVVLGFPSSNPTVTTATTVTTPAPVLDYAPAIPPTQLISVPTLEHLLTRWHRTHPGPPTHPQNYPITHLLTSTVPADVELLHRTLLFRHKMDIAIERFAAYAGLTWKLADGVQNFVPPPERSLGEAARRLMKEVGERERGVEEEGDSWLYGIMPMPRRGEGVRVRYRKPKYWIFWVAAKCGWDARRMRRGCGEAWRGGEWSEFQE